jgi:hypothetical protein
MEKEELQSTEYPFFNNELQVAHPKLATWFMGNNQTLYSNGFLGVFQGY